MRPKWLDETGGNPFIYTIWEDFSARPAASVHVQRSAQHRYRKMCQKWSIIIQLDPAHHAMILHILRHLRLANLQMLRQLGLESAGFRRIAPAAAALLRAASAANQIAEADSKCLAGFHVVRADLIRVRQQEDSRPGGRFVGFIEAMQRARHQASQHGFQVYETGG